MKIRKREPRLKPEDFPELLETADLVGDFIRYWGFKKVEGRIWACLFLMDRPLHTRQLTQLLKISSSLVSISMAELLKYGVILEAERGPNGVLLYRANPDAGAVIAGVLRQRERKLLQRIHASAAKLPRAARAASSAPARLSADNAARLGQWVDLARAFLEGGIDYVEASL